MLQKQTDPRFPQIPFAVDMTLMREALQKGLFSQTNNEGDCFVIEACRAGEQRYKPEKSCILSYHLQILNTKTKSVQEQIIYARLCKPGEGFSEFERASRKERFTLEGVRPIVYLPEVEMVVWSFPNDRKLTHLPEMLDLSFLYDLLPRRLTSLGLHQSKCLRQIKADIIHYLPERSCMIRYELELENRESGEVVPVAVFGKIYPDESGGEVYRIMGQLSGQMEGVKIAKPLGYDPELKVLWQSEIPGRPFKQEEIGLPDCGKVMAQMAVAVAAFHRTRLSSQRQFKLEDMKALLKETDDLAKKTCPQLTDRIGFLVHSLLTRSETIGRASSPITPIHGDLKIGNMLINEGKVGLIDMDCVCLGDPLYDIGSFIANFYYNGILIGCDESRIRALVEAFCRVYSEQVKWEVSQERLHWHIAAAFIYEIARRSIRQWNVKRMEHLNQYLDLSERYCFHRQEK